MRTHDKVSAVSGTVTWAAVLTLPQAVVDTGNGRGGRGQVAFHYTPVSTAWSRPRPHPVGVVRGYRVRALG